VPVRRAAARAGASTTTRRIEHQRLRLTIPPWDNVADTGRSWQDDEAGRVESHLRAIVVELIVAGEARYRAHAESMRQWLIERRREAATELRRRREEAERRERERLAKLEKERLGRLLEAANDWRRAADLRAFVEAVQAAHKGATSAGDRDRLTAWTADALSAADRLDPLRGGRFKLEIASAGPAATAGTG
jgi:hypothetical protein